MASRTRNPGTDWLATCALNPVLVQRKWAAGELVDIPSGRLWLAVEANILPSVAAIQRIGPERLGPVLELLAYLSRLTVHPEARSLLRPPADRLLDGLGWLEKPDRTATTLGAAFDPDGSGLRPPAGAFC
ncbi:hypothetical protein ACIA8E_32515 [Streptomyces sp. NPDC051664]|uniref:hypothetical protein n=1 Tax=Streptomyces sp. NPDC051664 TaxID=3365668 RepID=UPI0037894D08